MRWGLVFFLALAGCSEPAHSLERTPLEIVAAPVPMTVEDEDVVRGRLRYLGGFQLTSANENFGGISSLRFLEDGETLLGLTDRGFWLTLHPQMETGRFAGVESGWIRPMLDGDGAAVADTFSDSESMAISGRTVFVGFEGRHRIERFQAPWAEANSLPTLHHNLANLGEVESNGGLEGLTLLLDGDLLAGIEEPDANGNIRLHLFDEAGGGDEAIWLVGQRPFKLTDLATLPNGDVLTLERRFSLFGGVGAQLRLISLGDIAAGDVVSGAAIANFGTGDTLDNFEGLAVRERGGGIEIFIISDNNFRSVQRTLLLAFELLPE